MHNAQISAVTLWAVPQKRSQNPRLVAFGEWLREQRQKKRGLTLQRVSAKLAELGTPLGWSTLSQYENGTVTSPDAGVLWGLSRIYQTSLEQIVTLLTANRLRPEIIAVSDLLRHAHEQRSASNPDAGIDDDSSQVGTL